MNTAGRQRIGVFGGTFHPPHEGHTLAARLFLERAGLDFLFVIPARIPPHKPLEGGASDEDRYEMARIAFSPLGEKVRLLHSEMEREGASYTVDTLRELCRDFPESDFFLYVGSDMFLSFETWHEFRAVLKLCTLCVLCREEDEEEVLRHKAYLETTYHAQILFLGAGRPMSSTAIRKKLLRGGGRSFLDPHVAEYIENRGLYRTEE